MTSDILLEQFKKFLMAKLMSSWEFRNALIEPFE